MNVALTDSCFWHIRLPFLKLVCPLHFDLQLNLMIICLLLLNLLIETLEVVCPLCFAFRSHAENALESCSWHSVCNVSARFYHSFAHPESSAAIAFCIPNLFADCFSIMLLAHCAHGFSRLMLLCCPS